MDQLLRWISLGASALVILGFLLFALDQAQEGSDRQLARLENPAAADPGEQGERAREKEHGAAREVIDDANDFLLKPFAGIVDTDDAWVSRIVPGLIALLVYGLGLGMLANTIRGPARH